MRRMIYGLEMEYGITCSEEDDGDTLRRLTNPFFDEIFVNLSPVPITDRCSGFYINGSRIYLDTGCHPEYATPECASVKDLIRWDKAGERLFEEALEKVNRDLARRSAAPQLFLHKNNLDSDGSATFGCHENYLVSRRVTDGMLVELLTPFLVSRQIFCGAGRLHETGFSISQRARHIHTITNLGTTSDRPIINLRDEAWAPKNTWRRLHLIVGDANMSEVSTFLKVGTTALVLRMIEDGFLPTEFPLKLADAVEAIKEISAAPDCRKEVRLRGLPGEEALISAIEIQEMYLRWAKEYLSIADSPDPELDEVVTRWGAVLDLLKEDPMLLCRQIDWVAKKWLMESVLRRYGCDWGNFREAENGREIFDRLRTIDQQYHDIRREIGLYNLMAEADIVEKLVSEEEIQKAKSEAPQDTRAKWRSDFLRLVHFDPRFRGVRCQIYGWDKVVVTVPAQANPASYYSPSGQQYNFEHECPFNNTPPDVEEIVRNLRLE